MHLIVFVHVSLSSSASCSIFNFTFLNTMTFIQIAVQSFNIHFSARIGLDRRDLRPLNDFPWAIKTKLRIEKKKKLSRTRSKDWRHQRLGSIDFVLNVVKFNFSQFYRNLTCDTLIACAQPFSEREKQRLSMWKDELWNRCGIRVARQWHKPRVRNREKALMRKQVNRHNALKLKLNWNHIRFNVRFVQPMNRRNIQVEKFRPFVFA